MSDVQRASIKQPFDRSRAREVWTVSWKRLISVHAALALVLSLGLSVWIGWSPVHVLAGSLLAWSALYLKTEKALGLAIILGLLLDVHADQGLWGDAALVYALAVGWALLIRHRLPQLTAQALIYTGVLIELMVLILLGMLQFHAEGSADIPWAALFARGGWSLLWTALACVPVGWLLDKLWARREDE